MGTTGAGGGKWRLERERERDHDGEKDFLGDVAARDDVAREVMWTVHLVKTTYK